MDAIHFFVPFTATAGILQDIVTVPTPMLWAAAAITIAGYAHTKKWRPDIKETLVMVAAIASIIINGATARMLVVGYALAKRVPLSVKYHGIALLLLAWPPLAGIALLLSYIYKPELPKKQISNLAHLIIPPAEEKLRYKNARSTDFRKKLRTSILSKRTFSTQSVIPAFGINQMKVFCTPKIIRKKRSLTITSNIVSEEALIISQLDIAIISLTEAHIINYISTLGLQLLNNLGGLRNLLVNLRNKSTQHTLEQEIKQYFKSHGNSKRLKFVNLNCTDKSCREIYIIRITYIISHKSVLLNIASHTKPYLGDTVISTTGNHFLLSLPRTDQPSERCAGKHRAIGRCHTH
jgi:hypothetical protein